MGKIALVPATIKWARIYRGVSEADAAKILGGSLERLATIESEGGTISVTEFRKLARKYRLPEATLAMPAPPAVPKAPEDFRTLEGRDPTLSTKTLEAISIAQERQAQIAMLSELTDEWDSVRLPKATLQNNPEDAARRERERMGFTLARQLEIKNANRLFSILRELVEEQGVAVYALSFSIADCRGFSIYDEDLPPAIVVNGKEYEWTARVFTLMHEYAHLALHRPGISDERGFNKVERWCNRFAAEFLIPQKYLQETYRSGREPDFQTLRSHAERLGVSQQALALRLQALQLVSPDYYAKLRQQQQPRKASTQKKSGNYVNTQLFSLGPRFTLKVIRAWRAESIGTVAASRLLGLSPPHFARASRMRRGGG